MRFCHWLSLRKTPGHQFSDDERIFGHSENRRKFKKGVIAIFKRSRVQESETLQLAFVGLENMYLYKNWSLQRRDEGFRRDLGDAQTVPRRGVLEDALEHESPSRTVQSSPTYQGRGAIVQRIYTIK